MKFSMLIHNIPPNPPYLRAKVRQRLNALGAVALKNSVYLLPHTSDSSEAFRALVEEIREGGGEGYVGAFEPAAGMTDQDVIEKFRNERQRDYAALLDDIRAAEKRWRQKSAVRSPEAELTSVLPLLRQRLATLQQIDFFESPARKETEKLLERLSRKARPAGRPHAAARRKLRNSTWVTRRGIRIDRVASAWLVRRFIDPAATFRFIDPKRGKSRPGEITFDMLGADYTHQEDRCTFETLVAAFELRETAIRHLAEIIHDIDMKDGKFDRADAAGIRQLTEGIWAAHPLDEERLVRGFALLDDLYRSFKRSR